MTRFTLLGVPVDALSEAEAVDWVAHAIADGRPRLVISVNPERIMHAGRDPAFAAVLRSADLALADGAGVLWAARRLGHPLPGRVAGVDFVKALAARGAADGWRFFFLGGGPGVAEAAGGVLRETYPGFILAGAQPGSPDPGSDAATTQAVRSSQAQVLLLAYGAAAEEAWLARNLERSGAIIGLGVGGAFDFISGRARRAPRWMREHGLEWLHRLASQPWRWRRMLALPRFVVRVVAEGRRDVPDEGSP
ncbi:MAG: N-acetylglucosaminyldiphosphoundecaprenol N-acetyl-beta-D-mannosaminyltransferase [Chloroflexota bacterium]|nr:N-acetylglucosaminyldiphosphoundecaprenol N-acetyl-beta-D-mannosaminyltransferase [Chloroflexota bacterium]MEA2669589.1 N-acetylglucosaminyldiphosphoundecaprenol N-acetyl-beta-D-mannosaminyltransferase [Chloroflexota bacterium]